MSNRKVLSKAVKNLNKAKAPAKKADIDYVSKMGYRDDSPFRYRKSIDINTPNGTIDMGTPGNGTGIPLLANGRFLPPYSGIHQFNTNQVTEVPLDQAKKGGAKKYSRSLQAKNRLFVKNPLFKKPKKNPLFKKKNYKNKIYDPNAMYFQDGGVMNLELTPEEIEVYRQGGYIVEEVDKFQKGGTYYTVPGSKGVYRKVNGKWQVDFNRSGNFQPLSKGDVAKRIAAIEKNKTQYFDKDYEDLVSSKSAKYQAAPKHQASKPTAAQTKAQQNFDKNFKVTDKSKYEKVEDKIQGDIQEYKDYMKAKGETVPEDTNFDDMIKRGWERYGNVTPWWRADPTDQMKASNPEPSTLERAWEYATNPLTAFEYAVSGGGAENMPYNINAMRMAGIDPGVVEGRNMVGNTLNMFNLVDAGDKVFRNTAEGNYGTAALEALRFVPGARVNTGAGKFLTTKTPLKNTYKINPWAVKENPEMFLYRAEPKNFNTQSTVNFMKQEIAAGREKPWYKGVIKSYEEGHPKLVAQNDFHGQWFEKDPNRLDFYLNSGDKYDADTQMNIFRKKIPTSQAKEFSVLNNEKANVISASPNTEFVLPRNMVESAEIFPQSSWQDLIQQDKTFNTPHWLKGYKEVPTSLPGSPNATLAANTSFKSEIDWSKWNSEIPQNSELMKEYNAIEQTTKANGTWMKNPDGSPFQGTPEQFVQQNSQNFKKAFGESKLVNPDGSPWILEHGSPKKFDTFDESKFQLGDAGYSGSGIYTVPPKGSADSYTISGRRFHTGDIEPTIYKLYGQGNNPITSEELIKLGANSPAGKEMDLFNFHRKSAPLNEQLLDYDVAIHNQNRGIARVRDLDDAWEVVFPTNKQLKSAIGNNGMFDMTNPNIYKGIAPYAIPATIGLGAASAEYQEGGFIDIDIPDDSIQDYVNRGYIVEELDDFAEGGTKKKKKKKEEVTGKKVQSTTTPNNSVIQYATPWEDAAKNTGISNTVPAIYQTYDVPVTAKAPDWAKIQEEYQKNNPIEDFLYDKKVKYLKQNKGLNKAYGEDLENFPSQVRQNFVDEYNYKMNSYITKKLGKKKGFTPSTRGNWVDELSDRERQIVADSKYESKLQPSIWSRTLSGARSAFNALSPVDVTTPIPGYTKKENKAALNNWLEGLEVFAPLELSGTATANLVKNYNLSPSANYEENPNIISGERRANVNDLDVTLINPALPLEIYEIPELARLGAKGLKASGEFLSSNPKSWLQTESQRLENPELWKTINNQSSWSDPLSKFYNWNDLRKVKAAAERENKLVSRVAGNPKAVKEARESLGDKSFKNVKKEVEANAKERNLKRSRVPVSRILTERGDQIGGGQGMLFLNQLDPTQVVKFGTMPGEPGVLNRLVEAGKELKDSGAPGLENIALPEKAISMGYDAFNRNERGLQFMPWVGNPLDPANPVVKRLEDFGSDAPFQTKLDLYEAIQRLDEKNIGVDYKGANNIMYDPATKSYKLVDLNYVDDPEAAWSWNKADIPVTDRLAEKFGPDYFNNISFSRSNSPSANTPLESSSMIEDVEIPLESSKILEGSASYIPKNNEIKNISFYQQLLDNTPYSSKQRQYLQSIINTVKKQGSKASDRQYNILENLRAGNRGYSLSYDDILKLSDEDLKKITPFTKAGWKAGIAKNQDIGKLLETRYSTMYSPSAEQIINVSEGKKQLLDFYSSPEYIDRLKKGLNISDDEAVKYQKSMIDAVNRTNIHYVEPNNKFGTGSVRGLASDYNTKGKLLGVDLSSKGLSDPDAKYLVSHEFGHASLWDPATTKTLIDNLPKIGTNKSFLKHVEKLYPDSYEKRKKYVNYMLDPQESRQRGLNAILYAKNKGITTDELMNIPYQEMLKRYKAGELPQDILSVKAAYDQSKIKDYLKNLYVGVPAALGTMYLQEEKDGGVISNKNYIETELTPEEIKWYKSQGYEVEEIE
jgi:hypothetical protein